MVATNTPGHSMKRSGSCDFAKSQVLGLVGIDRLCFCPSVKAAYLTGTARVSICSKWRNGCAKRLTDSIINDTILRLECTCYVH